MFRQDTESATISSFRTTREMSVFLSPAGLGHSRESKASPRPDMRKFFRKTSISLTPIYDLMFVYFLSVC